MFFFLTILQPPRSTRTDTLFPDTTRCRAATTEIRKVPVTVLSRCQRFDLRRVEIAVLASHFKRIAEAEDAQIDEDALTLIARAAEGSVRDGDRKSTRLNSSNSCASRMPSSA